MRLFKAEVVEAILYGCATSPMRTHSFGTLRTAHGKLLLHVIGFRRKDRTRYKPLSYGVALVKTDSECIKTTTRKRQLGFAEALARRDKSRLSMRNMLRRLVVQGTKQGGRPATPRGGCPQKNLEAFGAIQRRGRSHSELLSRMDGIGGPLQRTWACGTGGSKKGAEALGNDNAW